MFVVLNELVTLVCTLCKLDVNRSSISCYLITIIDLGEFTCLASNVQIGQVLHCLAISPVHIEVALLALSFSAFLWHTIEPINELSQKLIDVGEDDVFCLFDDLDFVVPFVRVSSFPFARRDLVPGGLREIDGLGWPALLYFLALRARRSVLFPLALWP